MIGYEIGDEIIICERGQERRRRIDGITPAGNIKADGMLFNGETGFIKSSDPYATAKIVKICIKREEI